TLPPHWATRCASTASPAASSVCSPPVYASHTLTLNSSSPPRTTGPTPTIPGMPSLFASSAVLLRASLPVRRRLSCAASAASSCIRCHGKCLTNGSLTCPSYHCSNPKPATCGPACCCYSERLASFC